MSRYLVLPHLHITDANAMQAWWLMAPPSPMTVYGFVHAMERKCGFKALRFAMVHHDVRFSAASTSHAIFKKRKEGGREDISWDVRFWNQRIIPQQPQGATFINEEDLIAGSFTKSLQPTARCHTEMSIVLELDMNAIDLEEIEKFIWSGRLGGGVITDDHGKIQVCESLVEVKKMVGGGFWVVDRSSKTLETMKHSGIDGTEALIHILATNAEERYNSFRKTKKSSENEESEQPEKMDSWLSANVIGYATLEPLKERSYVRDSEPHAYAEPMVGLIQYESLRKSMDVPFWQYQPSPNKGVYLMKGN